MTIYKGQQVISGNGGGSNLPSQTGKSGKFLATDGTSPLWADPIVKSVIDSKDSVTLLKFWTGTKAQFDAIATKDNNTLYNVVDDVNPIDVTMNILQTLYPVGSLYITTANNCPLASLFGTWQLVGQDKVLQGAGTRGAVGTTLNESLPNIKGELNFYSGDGTGTGAILYTKTTGTNNPGSGNMLGSCNLNFDASRSSSTYQDNAPVQPDAFLVNIFRRTA